MRWTVTSPRRAQDELATIWMNATDRQAVTLASHEIDAGLHRDPLAHGSDLGTHRAWTVGPLTVWYTVSPDDCMVSILDYTSP
jgi:hypothetical protein